MSDFAYEEKPLIIKEYRAPGPVGQQFLQDRSFIRFIMGPMGSGKTTACLFDAIQVAFDMPKAVDGNRYFGGVVIRDTYTNLWNTTIRSWRKFFAPSTGNWTGGMNRPAEHKLRMRDLRDGSTVNLSMRFTALSDQSVEDALKGAEYTWANMSEADRQPEDVLTYLIGRIGRYPDADLMAGQKFWHGIVGDLNPPDTDNWLYRRFEEEPQPLHRLFKQPSGRDPRAENISKLPDGYYDRLIAANAGKKWWIRRNVDGQFGYSRDGLPVYEAFDDERHVSPRDLAADPSVPLLLSFDQGITQPAMTVLQYMPVGQLRVLAEYVPGRMSPGTFGGNCRALLNDLFPGAPLRNAGVCDPAGLSGEIREEAHMSWASIVSEALGLTLLPAETNELDPRIEVIHQLLTYFPAPGIPGLLISPRCKVLRKGMNSHYRYRKRQGLEGEYETRPQKNLWANVVEALQYGAMHIFGLQGIIGGGVRDGQKPRDSSLWRPDFPDPREQPRRPGDFDVFNLYMWNGPRCKDAFQSISPHEDGAVICPAYWCGHDRWPR